MRRKPPTPDTLVDSAKQPPLYSPAGVVPLNGIFAELANKMPLKIVGQLLLRERARQLRMQERGRRRDEYGAA